MSTTGAMPADTGDTEGEEVRTATILVIDDQIANLEVIKQYLAAAGFTILVAQDGESGLAQASYAQPDVILLDVVMPGIDGFETCRRLKAAAPTREIPVIFMTARDDITDKVTGFAAGGVDYVTKPFEVEELLARVRTHVALHTLQRQLAAQNAQLQRESSLRRQAEETLHESERRYRALIEQAPDAIVLLDLDSCRFVELNDSATRLFGLPRDALLQVDLVELSPPLQPDGRPSLELARERIRQAVAGESPAFEWTYRSTTGREIPCEVRLVFLPTAGRGLIRASIVDITERKKGEALRTGQSELLEMIVKGAPLKDTLTSLMRLIESQSEGLVCTVLLLDEDGVHPGAAPSLPESYLQIIDGHPIGPYCGSCGTAMYRREQVIVTDILVDPLWADYLDVVVPYGLRSCWSTPIFLNKDKVLGAFGMYYREPRSPGAAELGLIDVATHIAGIAIERERAKDELKRHRDHLEELVRSRTAELMVAKEAAEAANRAKSHFLANMSHELRTPLNAILGYAQILKRRRFDPDVISGLDTIQSSGEHLLTLINDILDLAKIEAGKLELAPAAIPLSSFLQTIADIIHLRAEKQRLGFTYQAVTPLPDGILADTTRLRQILLNLLDNAIKFTDGGHITLRVSCEAFAPKETSLDAHNEQSKIPNPKSQIRFEVEDTGIGIPPDQLERIFQPFEQVGTAQRRAEGVGLGLAISCQLVRLMGGDLRVKSEVGQGSTFWFELALPVNEAVGAAQAPAQIITGYTGPPQTVLIVDDIAANRTMLVDLLAPLGFEICEAVNGQEGLAMAQALHPDLIVLDMRMPVMDGLEATRRLRQLPALQATPIIAVSASASKADQAKSLEAGANIFVPKPIHLDALLPKIGRLLQLTWLYEPADRSLDEPDPVEVTPLEPPPPEELELLSELTLLGKMRQVRERAAALEQLDAKYRPFATHLQRLARGFGIKQVQTLLNQYLEADR